MTLGIGLGGFVDGFAKGYGLRQNMERDQLERAELQRVQDNRGKLDALNADAQAEFNRGVESGQFRPEDFDRFWTDYAMPRLRAELVAQGDYQGARSLMEWGESSAAREGGRLFASALFKAQTGNPEGALSDVIRAGQLNGYIEHGFELLGQDTITDDAGNVLGYRLSIKDANGEEMTQDIAVADLPMLISTFANPEAAWASQQAARGDAASREADLADFEAKEVIRRDVAAAAGPDQGRMREGAIKALRERMGGLLNDGPSFDDLSRDEQERLIQQEIDLQTGNSPLVSPAQQMVVDHRSGMPVSPSQAVPNPQSAPVLGPVPQPQGPSNAATAAPTPPAATPQPHTQGANKTQMLDEAAQMIIEGQDPNAIARRLTEAGIQPEEWPAAVRRGTGVGGVAW